MYIHIKIPIVQDMDKKLHVLQNGKHIKKKHINSLKRFIHHEKIFHSESVLKVIYKKRRMNEKRVYNI